MINIKGIYIIENTINNKIYIGQTSVSFKNRLSNHVSELKRNKHCNNHLQRAWNKYGEDNFLFDILEECSKKLLNRREVYWISYYESNNSDYGYNKTPGGEGYKRKPSSKESSGYIYPTEEMIKDVKNGMDKSQFKEKYNYGYIIWQRCSYDMNCEICGRLVKRTCNTKKYCKECADNIKFKQKKNWDKIKRIW